MAVTYEENRQRLKEQQQRLIKELGQLVAGAPPVGELREGSPFGKKEEGASETFEFEKRLALEKRLKELLGNITHALDKFEQETYGLCDVCGQPIEAARLEVLPQASMCLKCKSLRAKNAKGRFYSR